MTGQERAMITLEAVASGENLPSWLFEALCKGECENHLFLYPNEGSRSQILHRLAQSNIPVNTTHHLTLQRLIPLMILDLGLPPLLSNSTGLFLSIHTLTKRAAEDGQLPLLFAPQDQRQWSPYQTERLLSLHRSLSELNNPWTWDEDPGARQFDSILKKVEGQLGGTHPHHALSQLIRHIEHAEHPPFTLHDVEGIFVLDSAPDYTEVERTFLQCLAVQRPLHQLCVPGSFRLGHHGSYLLDGEWEYVTQESLPSWVPLHDIWQSSTPDSWRSPLSISRETSYHRITVHRRNHCIDAAFEVLHAYRQSSNGEVLIIDGSAESNQKTWSSRLQSLGYITGAEQQLLEEIPALAGLAHIMRVGDGLEAWSIDKLRSLFEHQSLPLPNGGVDEMAHPNQQDWRPRPHIHVMENIARSFHVRGGQGALRRWLATLSQATPQLGGNRERSLQELEETQWWLRCIAELWFPLLDASSQEVLKSELIGCSTGEKLPLPTRPQNGFEWLDMVLSQLDWASLSSRTAGHDRSVAGIQHLSESHKSTVKILEKGESTLPSQGQEFFNYIDHLLKFTTVPRTRSKGKQIQILTPEQAQGVEADLLLLVGLDVGSWPMKSSTVPWLDAPAKLRLGMLHSDLTIRKGRHHLRHLLNAAPTIVVFDTSMEEGGGPSAPLAEWFAEIRQTGEMNALQSAPAFIPDSAHQSGSLHRSWHWTPDQFGGAWLTPRPFTMTAQDGAIFGERAGHRGRDGRQRLGLALKDGSLATGNVLSMNGVAMAHEVPLQIDRVHRQPTHKNLAKNEYLPWHLRKNLVSTDGLNLRPKKSQVSLGSSQDEEWPHLGMKGSRGIGPAIDPRPLPPHDMQSDILNSVMGFSLPIEVEVWSPSRIQSWLECPRLAWMKNHLKVQARESQSEDLDNRTRGTMLHDAEAALLRAHGIPTASAPVSSPSPLHSGSVEQLWIAILHYLEQEVPWLARNDAVAVHRCREMLGITPDVWRSYLEGEVELSCGGRIGRMLLADYSLTHAAPLACEFGIGLDGNPPLLLDACDDNGDPSPFKIRGRIDRVDEVVLEPELRAKAISDGVLSSKPISHSMPLSHGPLPPANRLVVIRDLKTINGPKHGDKGNRHRRGIFDEVQLALYARAWELQHPGDRVVGIGVTEIGESTIHYLEMDESVAEYLEHAELGERTSSSQHLHRFPDSESSVHNGFRALLAERLRTSSRAINAARNGHVNSTPGRHYSYSSIRHVYPTMFGGNS